MKPTLNEKLIAYLVLFSGLSISIVAEYYSILGLTAIFAAATIPIVIMGIVLGVGKISATLWLKQNWKISPWPIKIYLMTAIAVLMLITSMGIFGFLSKAHSDQSLVSGDVLAKIAIYDEKIKTSKENIDVNRKALKQLDEAVDQTMARSISEAGADKATAVRRSQTKERSRLLQEIETEQKRITALNEERAPIAAEVRKVEAEVGPLKYIAAFVYGNTESTILEKAVTWVIITLIIVFDPLAVILLLSSQVSFQNFKEREREEHTPDPYVADVGEKPTAEEKEESTEGDSPEKESDVINTATVTVDEFDISKHPYLFVVPENRHPPGIEPVGPIVYKPESMEDFPVIEEPVEAEAVTEPDVLVEEPILEIPVAPPAAVLPPTPIVKSGLVMRTKIFKRPEVIPEVTEKIVQQALEDTVPPVKIHHIADGEYIHINGQTYHRNSVPKTILDSYVQNEEQQESNLWSSTTSNTSTNVDTK